jgi:hypothetical protein
VNIDSLAILEDSSVDGMDLRDLNGNKFEFNKGKLSESLCLQDVKFNKTSFVDTEIYAQIKSSLCDLGMFNIYNVKWPKLKFEWEDYSKRFGPTFSLANFQFEKLTAEDPTKGGMITEPNSVSAGADAYLTALDHSFAETKEYKYLINYLNANDQDDSEIQKVFIHSKFYSIRNDVGMCLATMRFSPTVSTLVNFIKSLMINGFWLLILLFTAYGQSSYMWIPVLWSSIFIFWGALYFFRKNNMELVLADQKHPNKQNLNSMNEYNPFWYALDLFIPAVNLYAEEKYKPKTNGTLLYARLLKIFGRLLFAVLFVCWSSIVK